MAIFCLFQLETLKAQYEEEVETELKEKRKEILKSHYQKRIKYLFAVPAVL